MASNTRARMIETTARLIQARGLHGVSLSEVLEESGAPRGSLYFHFPGGKNDLILQAMQAGAAEATRVLRDCLDGADQVEEGVRSFFRVVANEMAESGYAFGCPIAAVVLDAPAFGSELETACRAAVDEWVGTYRDALIAAGLVPARATSLARTILACLEGALIIARSERDSACITQVGDEVASIITAALSDACPSANFA
jgi:TetR/AcrR family transcriptional regulator, lmrAB and yxaGH operons repressor